MTSREMQYAFELEANRYDSNIMLKSHVIFYWLNESQDRYFKTNYSGLNFKREGFEQSQKRMDDLRLLVTNATVVPTIGSKPNSYLAAYPSDYVLTVGEESDIVVGGQSKRVEVHPITHDQYTREISSPFGRHILHYETANPLRLSLGNSAELITDGNYTISNYYLTYIKQPNKISLDGSDCELAEHTHREIVTDAVKLLLENLADPRYQSFKAEALEQE